MNTEESKVNSLVKKVIAWRILSTVVAFGLTLLFIGEMTKSLVMTVVFVITMTILHYYFEKWWEKK